MNEEQIEEYARRFAAHHTTIAERLERHVEELLRGLHHIDRVSARAKAPDRFASKARKVGEREEPKYAAPLQQIQDQIGARVIVFYRDDVDRIGNQLERYFQPVERQDHVPESQWEFGYFGRHWIFALPDDVIPAEVERAEVPRFFEMQVKTLYQHAWSEANHDLGYKATRDLTSDQQRRFAFTSAQSWGADMIFDELRAEILLAAGSPNP